MLGSTLIIAAACVLNNYLDQDIDRVMERTKNRPLVAGQVSNRAALIFCLLLLMTGVLILYLWTNFLVLAAGLAGFIIYVWLYGAWTKRQSMHGTLVGSLSGGVPILAGYLAASQQFDLGAVLVFLVVFLWQQPEFYSIAIYRQAEYQAAGIPLISIVKGVPHTQKQILAYIIAFGLVNLSLSLANYAHPLYGWAMAAFSLYWLVFGWRHLHTLPAEVWAKKMFRHAMYAILLVCLALPLAGLL